MTPISLGVRTGLSSYAVHLAILRHYGHHGVPLRPREDLYSRSTHRRMGQPVLPLGVPCGRSFRINPWTLGLAWNRPIGLIVAVAERLRACEGAVAERVVHEAEDAC
jgi:hypothetical protein